MGEPALLLAGIALTIGVATTGPGGGGGGGGA